MFVEDKNIARLESIAHIMINADVEITEERRKRMVEVAYKLLDAFDIEPAVSPDIDDVELA